MTIRLVLADDDDLVRTGLKMILESEPEFEIVGEASNGARAVELVSTLEPDVVLMDVQMPEMDGIEATRHISTNSPDDEGTRVLVLTTFELDEYVFEALRAGASGFLLKRTPADELIHGIRVVAEGEGLLSPSITKRLIQEFAHSPSTSSSPQNQQMIDSLTERELEVLALVSEGLSNQEIAERLIVSEGTVKTHIKRIFSKLEVRDRTQAVIFAYNNGIAHAGGN